MTALQAIANPKKMEAKLADMEKKLQHSGKNNRLTSHPTKRKTSIDLLGTWEVLDSSKTSLVKINISEIAVTELGTRFIYQQVPQPAKNKSSLIKNQFLIFDDMVGYLIKKQMLFTYRTEIGINSFVVARIKGTAGAGRLSTLDEHSCIAKEKDQITFNTDSASFPADKIGSNTFLCEKFAKDNANMVSSNITIVKDGEKSSKIKIKNISKKSTRKAKKKLLGTWQLIENLLNPFIEITAVRSTKAGVEFDYFEKFEKDDDDPFSGIHRGYLIGKTVVLTDPAFSFDQIFIYNTKTDLGIEIFTSTTDCADTIESSLIDGCSFVERMDSSEEDGIKFIKQ